MPAPAVDSLLDTLRQLQLVPAARLDELAREADRFPEPRALAVELVKRGLLTPYQVNLLGQDRAADLVLGAYNLIDRLGEGTRGQVFKARHQKMGRTVALKIIRKELLADGDAVMRFYQEVELASQLAHPNIVHAYDAGPCGPNHFLAMEFVEGVELAKLVANEGPLPWRQACAYVIQAALGLQHAFEKGLLHRGISPSNLFVTGRKEAPAGKKKRKKPDNPEDWGVVKIMDFGQGRLRLDNTGEDGRTPEGLRRSLLDFAAPEVARSSNLDVRSDIYSLGCTFYFLLTGRPPHPGNPGQPPGNQWQDLGVEEDLPTDVPCAVAGVLRRMIAAAPDDRYATPAEVADDLIRAAGGDRSLCGPTGVVPANLTESLPSDPAPREAVSPRQLHRDVENRRLRYVMWGGGGILVLGLAVILSQLNIFSAKPREEIEVVPEAVTNPDLRKLIHLARTRPETPELWNNFASFRLQNLDSPDGRTAGDYLRRVPSPLDRLSEKRIPRDEQYDWQPKELVGILGEQRWRVWSSITRLLVYSPTAKLLACSDTGDIVTIFDANTGRIVNFLRTEHGSVRGLAFSPDGKLLATSGDDKNVRLINPLTAEAAVLRGHTGHALCIAFAPDGLTLASGSADKSIRIWDVAKRKQAFQLPNEHKDAVVSVAFAADGSTLASGSKDGAVKVWDVPGRKARHTLSGHPGGVTAVAFDPHNKDRLASGGNDKNLRLWNTVTGHEAKGLNKRGFGSPISAIAFSPDGHLLAAGAAYENLVRLWKLDENKDPPVQELRQDAGIHAIVFLAEGHSLAVAVAGEYNAPRFWDLTPRTPTAVPVAPGHRRYLRQLAFTPDGRTLITLSSESAPRFWDLAALADRTTVGSAIYTNAAMALSPDGQTVAACSRDSKSVQLWDVTSAQSKGTFAKGHGDRIEVMAFAPDGTTLASGGRDKLVRLWEVNGGLEKKAIACDNNPTVLLFTPDGQTLVIGGPDIKHITLWDVTGGKERQDIKNIEYGMVYAALAPDGKTLAFVGKDNQVRLWDLSNSKEKSPPPVRHPAPIRALLFSLDGRTLIASAWDGQILFWKVSDRVLTRTIQLPGPVTSLALALDNRHLAAGTAASMVYLLRLGPVPSGE